MARTGACAPRRDPADFRVLQDPESNRRQQREPPVATSHRPSFASTFALLTTILLATSCRPAPAARTSRERVERAPARATPGAAHAAPGHVPSAAAPAVQPEAHADTTTSDGPSDVPLEEPYPYFEPLNGGMGDRMGRFAFVPPLPVYPRGPTTRETAVLLCPPVSNDERVRQDRCIPIDRLSIGETVYGELSFPNDRAFVLVLEEAARFYGPRGQRRGRPWAAGVRFPWDIHFTPGGRLLAHWGAGSCVDVHALFDERGRELPCAADGVLAPDGHHMLAIDSRWSCGDDGAAVWMVDLDTCRRGPSLELTAQEYGEEFAKTLDATGATLTFPDQRTVHLDMRRVGAVHPPRIPVVPPVAPPAPTNP